MPFVLILFLLAACVSACHPAYPTDDDRQLKSSSGGPLTARFFGVSTILLDDGNTAIMTDGFFSRPGAIRLLFGKIKPDPERIAAALKSGGVTKLSAVLTVHSHYDHAMDAPGVAKQWHAVLIGSESTANIARGEDFPLVCIHPIKGDDRQKFVIGGFNVMVFKSLHSIGVPGGAASEGTINAPLYPPVDYTDYKEGGTYSFLIDNGGFRILIHASSYYIPGMYAGVEADVVFLGIATLGKKSWQFVTDYWTEVVHNTKAKLVVPIHWDDFTVALDERPLRPSPHPLEDFPRAMEMLRALAGKDGVALRFMPLYEPVDIEAAAGWSPRTRRAAVPAPSSCP
jgi:L-ascorbate metabolism protein UlaG (beta-lactamase superfamily)